THEKNYLCIKRPCGTEKVVVSKLKRVSNGAGIGRGGKASVLKSLTMRLLYVVALAVSCSLCPVWTHLPRHVLEAFDFIFVVDSSLSLADHYKDSVVPFVADVANHFVILISG
ncbi:hypothetical protein GBAR_LOCUS27473, partial [Geodia barretti]